MFASIISAEVIYLAVRKANMTIDPNVYERFIKIAEKKGIRVSTWVNARMKEFVEQEEVADLKNKKSTLLQVCFFSGIVSM